MTGTIKQIMTDKLYGFINGEDGKSYFFHHSGCVTPFPELKSGRKVSFESVTSPKGPRAEGVSLMNGV